MNKNRIRLTESQLHRVIKESVKRVLSEMSTADADKNINDMIPNLDGERFQNMPKDEQNRLSWNCIDNAYDEHLNDLMAGEPGDNDNPFTWNNGPAAIGDEPIGFRQAMRPEYWRNRGVDGRFEDGYRNGGIGKYDPQICADIKSLMHDDEYGYTNLSEAIKRVVRKVLNEERNGPGTLSYLAMELISNNGAMLKDLGNVNDIKRFIESKVNKLSKTSKEQKYRFLYGDGSREYGGLMSAHSMNEIYIILGQMFQGGNGLGLTRNGMARRR